MRRCRRARATAAALLCVAVVPVLPLRAQSSRSPEPVRAFFNCLADACAVIVPTEDVPFVQWVRERADAAVSVLVTQQVAGGGGAAVTVVAAASGGAGTGATTTDARADTLVFTIPPGAPASAVRADLARWIRIALLRIVATRSGDGLDVSYAPLGVAESVDHRDPWHSWTITVGGSALVDDQQQSSLNAASLGVVATRITPEWKISVGGGFAITTTRTTLADSSEYRTTSRADNIAALVVRSIDDHWSVGARAGTTHSDFLNEERVWRIAAALEYDFYPYTVATHRQFTVRYQLGANDYRYADTTVFGLLHERRPHQSVVLAYGTQSLWGSIDSDLTWSSFLDRPSFYAVLLEVTANLTIARGLALTMTGTASRVNDQIYLRRAGLTNNEILAQQRAVATTYRATLAVGLTYTFGSIYSSVVNPRFAGTRISPTGRVPASGF